jgi:hypothetical protein
MAKTTDDLEAVRIVAEALVGFSPDDQERIIRWAREKLGLAPGSGNLPNAQVPQSSSPSARPPEPNATQPAAAGRDLKTFVNDKGPKNDVQFAAAVAYFYHYEALPQQRRSEIDPRLLQDACRLAGRKRLKNPLMTLNNAKKLGLLDSGSGRGQFAINTVGENLVAMTLPGQPEKSGKAKHAKKIKSQPTKKK